jgi:5-methylthioadenosine/S-adenosylhomocysteine deaminase
MAHVDTILTGGVVITMNQSFDLITDGAIAIQDSKIIAVDSSAVINSTYTADEIIACNGQYILPGFVNAHTHAPMTLLRGLADDLRLDVWLMGYIMPTEREFVSPEFVRLGTKLACAEMIRSGITAFADMYYYEADIAETTAEIGMRGVLGQTILKFPAPDAETFEDSLAYARRFIEQWKGHDLITPAIAPHAPYSSTEDLLAQCSAIATEHNIPVLIHVSETKLEEEESLRDYGMRVVPWIKRAGLLDAKVLAAHCVYINHDEMSIFHTHDTTVAHNPTSNLKIASGIAPVADMLENDLTVGIGTDGPASNNDLDMLEEIRLAAILAKTQSNDPTTLPARQALLMATRMGADALFIGDKTGSLETGKLADLIVIDVDTIHNMPHFKRDPDAVYSQIVYASKSTDVVNVMCNGQWLMRDRNLLTVDIDTVLEDAKAYAEKVDAFLIAHDGDILSKLLAVGGVERSESFEVQAKALMTDISAIEELLSHPDIEVLREVRYRQYDTYFIFDDPQKGRVRYREDDRIGQNGEVEEVRTRLTFTTPMKEREFDTAILLSHSRFIAPADRPLRFYQEYFQAPSQRALQKERQRWRIHYQGVLYFINIDHIVDPELPDVFIEIKSRTWSQVDAEHKAAAILRMLDILGIQPQEMVKAEYLEMQPV